MAYKRKSAEIYGPSKKSSKIDLNYPFTSSSSSSITPPFVNAPFYDENGQLSISVTQPVSIQDGSIGIAYDSSLETIGGKLGIKIDPNGAIKYSSNGLNLLIGGGLEEDEFNHLSIKVAPNQPIDVSNSGISLINDTNTLAIYTSSPNNQSEIGVKLEENGGLESSENGIAIKCDSTVTTDTDGLGVVINPNGPLNADENGIDLDYDPNSLYIKNINNTKSLSVLLNSNGALTSSSGLGINIDTSYFSITNNALTFSYQLPSVYIFTSGDPNLQNYSTARVMAKTANNSLYTIPCAYASNMKALGGIVHGYLSIKVRSSDASNVIPTDQQSSNPMFSFWLCRDIANENNYNFSNCTNNSYSPNTDAVKTAITPNGSINAWVNSSSSNFYLDNISCTSFTLIPNGDNDLENKYIATVNFSIVRISPNSSPQLVFTIKLSTLTANSYSLYSSTTNGAVTIGPIQFWYMGS
ncbi:protein fiber2 [Goose adenovirus 4]|nr:protein fiber2 [Goose adenovirus 4]